MDLVLLGIYGILPLIVFALGVWASINWLRCSIEDFRFNRSLKRAKNSDEFQGILLEVAGYFGGVVASNYDVRYVYNDRNLKIPKRHIEKALLFLSLHSSDEIKQSSQVLLMTLASFVPMPMSEDKIPIGPVVDTADLQNTEAGLSEFMHQSKLVDANYAKKFEDELTRLKARLDEGKAMMTVGHGKANSS